MSILKKLFKERNSGEPKNHVIDQEQYLQPVEGWYIAAPTSYWKDKFHHQINQINEKIRMSNAHRAVYYDPIIDAITQFYQALPASEYNHHSHSGGMIEHTLDVMNIALIYKLNFFYSESGKETDVENESDVFAYACFVACALHDIGKLVTDLDVVFKPSTGGKVKAWYPLVNPLPDDCFYKYRYNPLRQHKSHVLASPTMLTSIIPPAGIMWIRSYPKLFQYLINTIAGNFKAGGEIAQVVEFADHESANRSIIEGTNIEAKREANAPYSKGKKSTADIIVSMIRLAIESNEVRVNVAGGAVWVVGDKIYAVSKVIIDKARSLAAKAGYTALPENTVALFSMLCDAGYCERHPETNDIIHTIHLTMPRTSSEAWKSQLTFLVFKRDAIDPNNSLNLTDANVTLKDNTAKDGYKAKKAQGNTDQSDKETTKTDTEKEQNTPSKSSSNDSGLFTLDNSSLFTQKPVEETKPLSEIVKESTSTITVPTQKPANKGKSGSKQAKPKPAAKPSNENQSDAGEINLNPFSNTGIKPKTSNKQNESDNNKTNTDKSKNLAQPAVEESKPNEEELKPQKNETPTNKKPSKPLTPSYPTTEKQSPPNPFSKTLKANMSLQMFMTHKNMDEQKHLAMSNTPTSQEFVEWIQCAIDERFITYNMLHRYSEIYFLQEGVFICMPNLVHTYNKQQNKQVDSSSMMNALSKERYIHIGTTKVRTMIMKKRELKGLIIKYDKFNNWLVSKNIKIIEANKYVIIG